MKEQSLGLLFTKRTLLAGLVLLVCAAVAVFLVRTVQPEDNSKHLRKRRQHEQQIPIPPEHTAKKATKIPKKLRSKGMRKQWHEPVRFLVLVVSNVGFILLYGFFWITITSELVYKKVRKPEPENNDRSTMQGALEQKVDQVQNAPLCYRDFSDKDFVMTLAMKKKEDAHFLMIIDCWSRENNVQIPKGLEGIILQYFVAICSGFDMTPKTLIYGSKIIIGNDTINNRKFVRGSGGNDAYDVKLFTNVKGSKNDEKKYKCITRIAKRTKTDDGQHFYGEPVYILPGKDFESAKEVWLSRDGNHLGMISRHNTYVLYQLRYYSQNARFKWSIKRYIGTINDYSAHGACMVENAGIHFFFAQETPDKVVKVSVCRDNVATLNKQEIDLIPLLSKESIDMDLTCADLEELFVENSLSDILLGVYLKWFAFGKHKKALQKRLIPYVYIPYARTIGISWDGEQLVLKHQAWYKFQYIYPFVGTWMGGSDREVEGKELTLGIPKSALL